MKPDERAFLIGLARYLSGAPPNHMRFVRNYINDYAGINHKRAWYLLEKWSRNGLYEYGVSLDMGWLTEKGLALARELETKT